MKSLPSMYMHMLYDEKEGFWEYIDLFDMETSKDRKAIWYAIATDELQHFAKIKDTIWSNMNERTEMEKALFAELHEEYEKMKKCLERRK